MRVELRLRGGAGAAALVGIVMLAMVLVGCTSTALPTETAPSPSATATPKDAWVKFTTDDGLAFWTMPSDWSAIRQGTDELGQVTYDVNEPDGHVRLRYAHKINGLGGPGCIPGYKPAYPYQTLDHTDIVLPVAESGYAGEVPPRVAYEAIQYPDHVSAGLGITNGLQGTDGTACEFLHFVTMTSAAQIIEFAAQYPAAGGPWGDKTFTTMDEAQAYRDTDEYRTLTRILASLQLKDAPAGLDGVYNIVENADCGIFDLTGQVLTASGGIASITTPGQTLTGTAVESSGVWDVTVSGAQSTRVQLTGTVSGGVYRGSGTYGGIHLGGETGWSCVIPSFTATPR